MSTCNPAPTPGRQRMLPQRQQYPRPALPLRSLLCLVRKTLRSRSAPSLPAEWSALKPAVPDPPAVWGIFSTGPRHNGAERCLQFFSSLFRARDIANKRQRHPSGFPHGDSAVPSGIGHVDEGFARHSLFRANIRKDIPNTGAGAGHCAVSRMVGGP